MEDIKKELKKRETLLLKWKKQVENALKNAPEGSLRICKHGQTTQYYHRTDPHDINGKYIPRSKEYLAQALAQKDYNEKILAAIEKELKAIHKFSSSCPKTDIEHIYNSLHYPQLIQECCFLPIKMLFSHYKILEENRHYEI